ncbi:hypothetical protein [Zunongwangia endophytica]|nr:hypothetical protein [Zunongwangia endophytica]MDN3596647.1 hypothetical protein [Zunongwangia endophytica]
MKRKKIFPNGKWKWFWISTTVFFGIYLLIVGGATYCDISSELTLQKFDLDRDEFINGEEITVEQKEAMSKAILDTRRNFSSITGLILSGIIALFVLVGGKLIEYISIKIKDKN